MSESNPPAPSGNGLGYGPVKPLAVSLNGSTRAQLDIIAQLRDRNVTDEVRLVIDAWIEQAREIPLCRRSRRPLATRSSVRWPGSRAAWSS